MPSNVQEFLLRHATETVGHFFGLLPSTSPDSASARPGTRRRPKADLIDLIRAGLLKTGQTLFLHDYQGRRIPGMEAEVKGKKLSWEGRRYSPSRLATLLLNKQGYSSDSVRGPARWFTETGESVKTLWEEYQGNRQASKAG